MRSQDGHVVAERLQADGGIDDETLCATDAEVGVDKDDVPAWRGFRHAGSRC